MQIAVQVVGAPSGQADGSAAIRLRGVRMLPRDLNFRIEPFQPAADGEPLKGWPTGDLVPKHVRQVGNVAELMIGSEITSAPALKPGTLVAILIPAIGLRHELRWPRIPGTEFAAPDRSTETLPKSRATAAGEAALRIAKAKATPPTPPEPGPDPAPAPSPKQPLVPREDPSAPHVNGHDEKSAKDLAEKLAEARADIRAPRPINGHTPHTGRRPTSQNTTGPQLKDKSPCSAKRRAGQDARDGERGPPEQNHTEQKLAQAAAKPAANSVGPASVHSPIPSQLAQTDTGRSFTFESDGPAGSHPKSAPRADARSFGTASQTTDRSWLGWFGIYLLGAATMAALFVGLVAMANTKPNWLPAPLRNMLVAQPNTAVSRPAHLAAVLAVPAQSPRGRANAGVTHAEALAIAATHLEGTPATTDKAEARYWLRRAIALRLDARAISPAATELGSLYAQPERGSPDYVAARLLWELAAARGDAKAMCFLGALYQHGLGVDRDINRAIGFYADAIKTGRLEGRNCNATDGGPVRR